MNEPLNEPARETIRILHTADWHLGREFHGKNLSGLHEAFFDWLAGELDSREVDVLVMAGDIYDRSLPPLDAIEILNRVLVRFADICDVVLITGNHDSTIRMSHGPLLRSGIFLRSGTSQVGDPVLIEGTAFPLAIYPIPYLDPGTSAQELDVDSARHEPVVRAAVQRSLRDLETRPGTHSLGIGHAFVQGGEESDSERNISIGDADRIPVSTLEGFDYVALGHLHRAQGSAPNIRYSGSPIPLSYSEVGPGLDKSVVLVDMDREGRIETEIVPVPQAVEMARISGTLEDLVTGEEFDGLEDTWLEITLTDESRPDQPMERLRSRFNEVISLRFDAPITDGGRDDLYELTTIAKESPLELTSRFLDHVRARRPDAEEESLLTTAIESRASEETA